MHPQGHRAQNVRLTVERLIASADLQPPSLPPAAVLLVRRLTDPQPGRLAPSLGAVRVHADWERAVRQRLAELQRRAVRPALGAVWGDAEAVLFADEAELLACLARDITRGMAGQRWWWQALLRSNWTANGPSASQAHVVALVRHLTRQAHLTPAVLARLQEWGEAVAAVRLLTPAQAQGLLQAMTLAYGLASLLAEPPARLPPQSSPWLPGGAEVARPPLGLGRERDALLSLALDLAARPQVVASQAYQQRFQVWWHRPASARFHPSSRSPNGVAGAGALLSASPHATGTPATGVSAAAVNLSPAGPGVLQPVAQSDHTMVGTPNHAGAARPLGAPGDTAGGPLVLPEAAPPLRSASDPVAAVADPAILSQPATFAEAETGAALNLIGGSGEVNSRAPDGRSVAGAREFSPTAVTPTSSSLALADGVPTGLGGVLYLINLMVALDLPDCFEEGWRLASAVGPWGLLHALGWELLAAEGAASADDRLWLALAHLDGRALEQPPGARLPAYRPRRWPPFAMPAAWFAAMPDVGLMPPHAAGSRRRGVVADLRNRYPPLLARWLAQTLPFIALRLRLALGLNPDAGLAAALLCLPGQLYVTRTHVDLVAALEHISLPVRLAGLDRNPGWLPNFARVITFHFR